MSDFVERCRREWRRLGVPAAVADDMASELHTDLEEAGADGVSAQELLGSAAGDPRAFAASWAAERGVVPSRRLPAGFPARSRVVVATAALLSVAAIAAGTTLFASPTARSSALPPPFPDLSTMVVWVAPRDMPVSPDARVVFQPPPNPETAGDSRQTVAWSLLIAGLVAFALSVLYRWRTGAQVRRSTS